MVHIDIRSKVLAVLLAVFLTVNGVYDFVVILKDNDSGHRVAVNMDKMCIRDRL